MDPYRLFEYLSKINREKDEDIIVEIYYHRTIEKYIIGLLNTFNNIKLPIFDKAGKLVKEVPVPIFFGSRDKAYQMNNTTKNLVSGNSYSLPRMNLQFLSMSKAGQRDTSKHSLINITDIKNNKKVGFQFNSVAYDFQFQLQIQTRTLTDALIITEYITPLLRPTYTIPVYEVDIQQEPTSVIVELQSVDLELPDAMEDDELRIISVNMPLNLRGNIYLPEKDQAIIRKIRLYLNEKVADDFNKSIALLNLEVANETENGYDIAEFETEDESLIKKIKDHEGHKGW